jgi:transcriptional regulator with PAS, ATPase and Fis domain
LNKLDVQVDVATGKRLVWEDVTRQNCDLVICGESVVPDAVESAMAEVLSLPYSPGVAMVMDYDDLYRASTLRAAGLCATIFYGLDDALQLSELQTIVEERRELLEKTVAARRLGARPNLSDFVSHSVAMQQFVKMARQVASSDVTLLITGETGVGKERLARAVHEASPRSKGPFIAVNCGAIPENLIESELFGHEEGAFTGATRSRRGAFELAHRGTIFLDEIGEMAMHMQVKLLRVLQDFMVSPVGSEGAIPVDVRVMAATNKNVLEEIEEERFRKDLYYRLSVIKLPLPALRERPEDIPTLVDTLIAEIGMRIGKRVAGILPEAMDALCRYAFPGNIRELINILERGILLTESKELRLVDLPEEVRFGGGATAPQADGSVQGLVPDAWMSKPLKEVRQLVVDQVEREYLVKLLAETQGRIGETAGRAGIEPRSLNGKMTKYSLRKESFKRKA